LLHDDPGFAHGGDSLRRTVRATVVDDHDLDVDVLLPQRTE
jgi:hypothetical protein